VKIDEAVSDNDGQTCAEIYSETFTEKGTQINVAVGSLLTFRASLLCIVIAEDWPTWMPVLLALGAKVKVVIGRCEFIPDKGGLDLEEYSTNNMAGLELGSAEADNFLLVMPRST
jgi:hypothetical protein